MREASRPAPTRLRLELETRPEVAAKAAELAAAETQCCSFFTFTLIVTGERLTLEVSTPAAYADVLDAIATHAAQRA